jgi:hypothetical protein
MKIPYGKLRGDYLIVTKTVKCGVTKTATRLVRIEPVASHKWGDMTSDVTIFHKGHSYLCVNQIATLTCKYEPPGPVFAPINESGFRTIDVANILEVV